MLRGEGDRRWAVGPAIDTSLFVGEGTTTWAFICTPRAGGSLDDPQSFHYVSQQEQLYVPLPSAFLLLFVRREIPSHLVQCSANRRPR